MMDAQIPLRLPVVSGMINITSVNSTQLNFALQLPNNSVKVMTLSRFGFKDWNIPVIPIAFARNLGILIHGMAAIENTLLAVSILMIQRLLKLL